MLMSDVFGLPLMTELGTISESPGDYYLIDSDLRITDAEAIAHAVNNHDRLVAAFKDLFINVDSLHHDDFVKYEALLKELEDE